MRRKAAAQEVVRIENEKLVAKAATMSRQSVWMSWSENSLPYDLSWKNLIWGNYDSQLIAFVLNASTNSVISPNLQRLWGHKSHATCPLKCGATNCTLHHILSNCSTALNGKRYTWRHDSVLNTLKPILIELIAHYNGRTPQVLIRPAIQRSFVSAGESKRTTKPTGKSNALLASANDWKLLIDFYLEPITFPAEICPTRERPDIIIWSHSTKTVILCELTCPAEEGIQNARIRKLARYNKDLVPQIKAQNPKWSVHLMTIEAGARGFVAFSFNKFLRRLGLSPRKSKTACHSISRVVARCSFDIHQQRSCLYWPKAKPLLIEEPR